METVCAPQHMVNFFLEKMTKSLVHMGRKDKKGFMLSDNLCQDYIIKILCEYYDMHYIKLQLERLSNNSQTNAQVLF